MREQPFETTERHNRTEPEPTMRKILLPLAVTLLTCTTAFAQESVTKPMATETKAHAASDGLMHQKRQLSGELKGAMGQAQELGKRAMDLASTTSGAEHDKYTAASETLKGLQARITEQLELVNKATEADSKSVFSTAREQIVSFRKELDEQKGLLTPTGTEKVPMAK